MTTEYLLDNVFNPAKSLMSVKELEYLAFSGQYERVHAIFKRIPIAERKKYANKYILHQVVWGSIVKLRKLWDVQAEKEAEIEKAFIDQVVDLFIDYCKANKSFPKELFQTLLSWSDELVKLSLTDEAMALIETAVHLGSHKFPDIQSHYLTRLAQIYSERGHLEKAHSILSALGERPYLITDRHQIPEILFNLGTIALMIGETEYYKNLLFLGLRHFYTNMDDRCKFVDQLSKTYRRFYRVLLHKEVQWADKFLYFIHWIYHKSPNFNRVYLGGITWAFKMGILGYVYCLNYLLGYERMILHIPSKKSFVPLPITGNHAYYPNFPKLLIKKRRNILITRAMGGIGDLLTMTPGIHALKQKYPAERIYLAIPKIYFPVFEHNPDMILIDIEKEPLNYTAYRKWYNFTDCPAARTEALSAPRVKKNRIDIFARALGIKGIRLWRMNRRPRYFYTEKDRAFWQTFCRDNHLLGKNVIGVQLYAEESYRDYPDMETLISVLSGQTTVLVFDAKPIEGFNFENVIKIDSFNLRQAFALAGRCDALIAPDSAFLHLAGALNIPCLGLFGPLDGKLRTKPYPTVEYLDAHIRLGCIPCWRNENIPCKLTGMRRSVCMGHISVAQIIEAVNRKLTYHKKIHRKSFNPVVPAHPLQK